MFVVEAPPAGAPAEGGTIAVRRGEGATSFPLRDGRAVVPAGEAPIAGVEVERAGQRLLHGAPPRDLGSTIRVAWPRAPLPPVDDGAAASRTLRVEDATGRPLEGADVSWTHAGREGRTTTDAAGRAEFPDATGSPLRLCAVAPGHGETCVYASLAAPGPLVVRLPRLVRRTTTFTDPASGEPVRPTTLRLVTPDGTPRTVHRPDEGYERFDLSLPEDLAARASLEVETPGRPTVRVPLAAMGEQTSVPSGRTLDVRVRDAAGTAVAGVAVAARYAPGSGPEAQDEGVLVTAGRTDADGRVRLAVPAGRASDLLVVPAAGAPTGVRVGADAPAEVDVVLEAGVAPTVLVRDADGAPVAGALVLCVARAGRSEVRREGRTDAQGRAILAPVAPGRVEVFAHAPGRAWAAATVDLRPGSTPVPLTLAPGHRLHVVVEDPWGVPLEGVRAQAVPRPTAAAQGPDAGDPDAGPWRTDAHGVLDVPDLPARSLDLHVRREGYEDEVLRDVTPGDVTWWVTLVPAPR
jgi:hypothetical protein